MPRIQTVAFFFCYCLFSFVFNTFSQLNNINAVQDRRMMIHSPSTTRLLLLEYFAFILIEEASKSICEGKIVEVTSFYLRTTDEREREKIREIEFQRL